MFILVTDCIEGALRPVLDRRPPPLRQQGAEPAAEGPATCVYIYIYMYIHMYIQIPIHIMYMLPWDEKRFG